MLLIDGAAVMSFVSAHVPPTQLELFRYLIGSFHSMKLNLSPNGIHGQNFILAVLLYRHVANEAGIW